MTWLDDIQNKVASGEMPVSEDENADAKVWENRVHIFERSCAENGIARTYNLLRALQQSNSSLKADLNNQMGAKLLCHLDNSRIICITGEEYRCRVVALWLCWQAIKKEWAKYFNWINAQRIVGPLDHNEMLEQSHLLVISSVVPLEYPRDGILLLEDILLLRYEACRSTILIMDSSVNSGDIQIVFCNGVSNKIAFVDTDEGTWG